MDSDLSEYHPMKKFYYFIDPYCVRRVSGVKVRNAAAQCSLCWCGRGAWIRYEWLQPSVDLTFWQHMSLWYNPGIPAWPCPSCAACAADARCLNGWDTNMWQPSGRNAISMQLFQWQSEKRRMGDGEWARQQERGRELGINASLKGSWRAREKRERWIRRENSVCLCCNVTGCLLKAGYIGEWKQVRRWILHVYLLAHHAMSCA